MSKSNPRHELLQDQLATDDQRSTQRSSKVVANTNHERDSVTPFAKDVVDNVVTGALGILDISRKEGKPWKDVLSSASRSSSELSPVQNNRSVCKDSPNFIQQDNKISDSFSLASSERPVAQIMHMRVSDDLLCDSVHAEQVAKIVKGLQDIQIGDSAYVLPADRSSNVEKQVKRAVRNINSLELGEMETAQLIIRDGQGDVDAVILQSEGVGPASNANCKPQHDGSKISTCFLHKMIEELEDDGSTKGNFPEHGNKEGIASWEESEEKFIRVIEGLGDESVPALLERLEYRQPVIFYQESMFAVEEITANPNTEGSSDQNHKAFGKEEEEEEINDRLENGNRPRSDCSDDCTDEDPYWCTAGLITRVVTTSRHGDVLSGKTKIAGIESVTSNLARNLEIVRNETSVRGSVSIVDDAGENSTGKKSHESKVKGRKKTSLGRRLRNFFSKFKRNRDC